MFFETTGAPAPHFFQRAVFSTPATGQTAESRSDSPPGQASTGDQLPHALDPKAIDRFVREKNDIITLYNIGLAIGASLEMKEVLQRLHKESSRLLDTANFAIVLYDEAEGTLNFALVFDQGQPVASSMAKGLGYQALIGHILTGRSPLLISDLLDQNHPDETSRIGPDKPARSWLGVPICSPALSGGEVLGAIITWSDQPQAFTDHDLWVLSAIGTQAAIAIRNARLFEASRRRTTELSIINEVIRTLTSTLQLDDLLDRIMEQVESLFKVRLGWLLLTDPTTGALVCHTGLGQAKRPPTKPAGRIFPDQGRIGRLVQTGKPFILSRAETQASNVLGAPLVLHDQVIGVLVVMNQEAGGFTQADAQLLSAIASHAAIAIENARLHESVLAEQDRLLAVESQVRREVAHDLHDGPVQLVSGMVMQADFCHKALQQNRTAQLSAELAHIKQLGQEAMHQMRTLLVALRPLELERRGQGLVAALQMFLKRRQEEVKQTRLSLICRPHEQISRLDAQVEKTIFTIVRETVTNAIKHAQATQIRVELTETTVAIEALIIDDGCGFAVEQVMDRYSRRGSLGLLNIRERAETAGGDLRIESAPNQGARITLAIPKAKADRLRRRGATTGRLGRPAQRP